MDTQELKARFQRCLTYGSSIANLEKSSDEPLSMGGHQCGLFWKSPYLSCFDMLVEEAEL